MLGDRYCLPELRHKSVGAAGTSHVHPVNIAEGGDPPVHLVLQVEVLGVGQLPELLWSRAEGTRCGSWTLSEDVIESKVHCLGLQ